MSTLVVCSVEWMNECMNTPGVNILRTTVCYQQHLIQVHLQTGALLAFLAILIGASLSFYEVYLHLCIQGFPLVVPCQSGRESPRRRERARHQRRRNTEACHVDPCGIRTKTWSFRPKTPSFRTKTSSFRPKGHIKSHLWLWREHKKISAIN